MFRTIRRAFLWIIIPMVSSIFAGVMLTIGGYNNMIANVWLSLMGICIVAATVEEDIAMAISVALWGLDAIGGVVYGKVLQGWFEDTANILYILFFFLLLMIVALNIGYVKEMEEELRRANRKDKEREEERARQEEEERQEDQEQQEEIS